MSGSSTASSSPIQSSPPPRMQASTRPIERPEGHGTIQSGSYSGYEGGSSRVRAFPIRAGSERKRRLTSTGEDARLHWRQSGGTAGPARDNGGSSRSTLPHRSVSMVLPSSRARTSIPAAPGSSFATAIAISSSPPGTPHSSTSGEQLPGLSRRENPTPWINQSRSITPLPNNISSPFMDMALPKWQADSDVSECPICGIVFSFWHRKHHCRKCGRVVCASCSPHRITIPREYIVRPPEFVGILSNSPPMSSRPPPVVDLTGDDPILSSTPATATETTTVNPALGGGEEVRLCNPCVPDPNPNPPGYSTVRAHSHQSTHSLSSTMANAYHASSGSSQNPQGRQERRTVGANDRPHLLSELNSQPRQVPSATGIVRPCRSFCSREGNLPCGPSLDESDFCPVCRRQFLPLSPDRPLEARQAHTRACIEGYLRPTPPSRTSSVQLGPPLPHLPPATHMLQFVATEKDCLGEDGQAAECTICMEDYEVGQILARLECLCKFHKHCIVDWFERKMECPVHKLS
ncbi:hypothetical protein PDIG_17700 [Penicillium digitatum PHI26]|uniref:RING-type E3 ubiquitin transferase n=2 Tax=Penicillium digitatum TaxID=36651 RepID=K9G6D2_PEND2|nr:hypothetical protein PDIP_55570 [Penicillium digitatum Pd1]EKV11607.1 hypothetical protein PDIP_55570 [Penicillium digitatum Pd1]EKV16964.1 hypothetical protein PDIG_17700 [Penicillium digitatum PHI26]KAG0152953.1 hypothetical protein PDIDSM_1912 [Penicillium digitatum]